MESQGLIIRKVGQIVTTTIQGGKSIGASTIIGFKRRKPTQKFLGGQEILESPSSLKAGENQGVYESARELCKKSSLFGW